MKRRRKNGGVWGRCSFGGGMRSLDIYIYIYIYIYIRSHSGSSCMWRFFCEGGGKEEEGRRSRLGRRRRRSSVISARARWVANSFRNLRPFFVIFAWRPHAWCAQFAIRLSGRTAATTTSVVGTARVTEAMEGRATGALFWATPWLQIVLEAATRSDCATP